MVYVESHDNENVICKACLDNYYERRKSVVFNEYLNHENIVFNKYICMTIIFNDYLQ